MRFEPRTAILACICAKRLKEIFFTKYYFSKFWVNNTISLRRCAPTDVAMQRKESALPAIRTVLEYINVADGTASGTAGTICWLSASLMWSVHSCSGKASIILLLHQSCHVSGLQIYLARQRHLFICLRQGEGQGIRGRSQRSWWYKYWKLQCSTSTQAAGYCEKGHALNIKMKGWMAVILLGFVVLAESSGLWS